MFLVNLVQQVTVRYCFWTDSVGCDTFFDPCIGGFVVACLPSGDLLDWSAMLKDIS